MIIFSNKYFFYILLGLYVVAIYLGLQVDIMDIDASQYASMSQQMLKSGNFLELFHKYKNYLDKPPLTFWLGALSFNLFGYHNWSYKLPSLVFALMAVYSVYKLSLLYYSKNASILSAASLACCQAIFLITNDCRTDTYLLGSVAFASWQLAAYIKTKKWFFFLGAFIGIGIAMLAKGPIGIMSIGLAFSSDLLLKRDFKTIFKWQWIFGLLVILIVLSPMCYGLWTQYGYKGIKFFFWDQSFGRITGSNHWKNDGGFFFMFHSFAWSLLPFTLYFLVGLFLKAKKLILSNFKVNPNEEYFSFFGFILVYIAMSKSSYQLPHYIYVVLPYAAIITGSELEKIFTEKTKYSKILKTIQWIIISALWILVGVLALYAFNPTVLWSVISLQLLVMFVIIVYFIRKETNSIVFLSLSTMISVNIILGGKIYPEILKYQSSKLMASDIVGKGIKENEITYFDTMASFAADFYANMSINEIYMKKGGAKKATIKIKNYKYIIVDEPTLTKLKIMKIEVDTISKYKHYPVSRLTGMFINPNTRNSTLMTRYLLKIKKT